MEKLVLGNQVKLVMTGPDQVEQEIPCASHFWKNGYHYFLYEEKLEGYEKLPNINGAKTKTGRL